MVSSQVHDDATLTTLATLLLRRCHKSLQEAQGLRRAARLR
jgi:hypothetical protein